MTEADLLDAIDADPESDPPRQALADWCEGRDPQRARMIRLQVRAARALPGEVSLDDQGEEARLLEANRARWLAHLAAGVEYYFRRGVPECIAFTSRTLFEKSWKTLLTPRIRNVCFREVVNLARVATCPGLARIRELQVWQLFLSDETLLELAASPHLAGLRALEIICGRPTAASLVRLARLPALERLVFHSSIPQPLAIEGTRAIAGMERLRSLELKGWRLDDAAARALWSGRYPHLSSLSLRDCGIGPGGMAPTEMPRLERLDLGQDRIGDEGAGVVAGMRWPKLRWLSLSGNVIGAAGAASLSQGGFPALEALELDGNSIPDDGAEAFARHNLTAFTRLDLSNNLIGDRGMRAIAGATSIRLRCHGNPAAEPLLRAAEEGRRAPEPARPTVIEVAPAAVVGSADEDGLVRALLVDPWDGLARAAYADLLEEQGLAKHAEMLRPASAAAPYRPLEQELSGAAHEAMICGGMGYPKFGTDGLWQVRISLQSFIGKNHQPRISAGLRQHRIERVELDGKLTDWTRLAAAPVLEHLRALDLGRTAIRDDGLTTLASHEGMSRLCALSLESPRIGPEGIASLASSPNLGRLVALNSVFCVVADSTMRMLAGGPLTGRLRRVRFDSTGLGDSGLGILLASPAFCCALTTLELSGCLLTDRSLGALASAPLESLRNLDLSNNLLTSAGLAILAASPLLKRLRRLRLADVYVRDGLDPLVRAVADVPGLTLVLSGHLGVLLVPIRAALGERIVVEAA